MFLKKTKYKDGRIFLSITEGYYDKIKKTSRGITIQKLGYLDELEKIHNNSIAHFTQVAKDMTAEKNFQKEPISMNSTNHCNDWQVQYNNHHAR